jgi:Tetratricopeptide repeat
MNLRKLSHIASCLFALIALLAAPTPSVAAPGDSKASRDAEASAREHFQRGQRLSARGDYAGAYREFAAGYALTERPLFLFNMAEAARASGDLAKARENYLQFLRLDPKSALAATAQGRIAEIDRAASTATPPPSQGASGTTAAPAPAPGAAVTTAAPSGPSGATPSVPPSGAPAPAAVTTAPPSPEKPPVRLVPPPERTSPPASPPVSTVSTTALPADHGVRGSEASAPIWKTPTFWAAVSGAAIAVTILYAVSRSDGPCSSSCTELDFR